MLPAAILSRRLNVSTINPATIRLAAWRQPAEIEDVGRPGSCAAGRMGIPTCPEV